MVNQCNEQEAILLEIAYGESYETEYAGRTYECCKYCGTNVEDTTGSHPEECLMERARASLGKKWEDFNSQRIKEEQDKRDAERRVQREHHEREEKLQAKMRAARRQVECERCHRTVSAGGLAQHHGSQRCQKRASKLRELEN
jgi:hypothetical protein